MKGFSILFLILIILAPGIGTLAAPFTIGTFDLDRGGIGSLLSDDRAAVRASVTSGFHDVVIDGAPVLTEAWANNHDILWLDAVKASIVAIVPLSTDEQQVLGQFVLNGGESSSSLTRLPSRRRISAFLYHSVLYRRELLTEIITSLLPTHLPRP